MTKINRNSCPDIKSILSIAGTHNRIKAQDEAELVEKFIWLKTALNLKRQLACADNLGWANALDISVEQLIDSVTQAESANKRLMAMGLRLSLTLAKKQINHCFCEDLSDLLHEGLVTFYDALDSYDSSRGIRLSTYAYSCIKSRFVSFNRRHVKSIKASTSFNFNETASTYPEYKAEIKERQENLWQALHSLPERQRTILVKKYGIQCEIQSIRDIAKDCNISLETVRRDQNAAIRFLSENRNLQSFAS
jgi:RNA polymerase sigma factor (sigma-70 family)